MAFRGELLNFGGVCVFLKWDEKWCFVGSMYSSISSNDMVDFEGDLEKFGMPLLLRLNHLLIEQSWSCPNDVSICYEQSAPSNVFSMMNLKAFVLELEVYCIVPVPLPSFTYIYVQTQWILTICFSKRSKPSKPIQLVTTSPPNFQPFSHLFCHQLSAFSLVFVRAFT